MITRNYKYNNLYYKKFYNPYPIINPKTIKYIWVNHIPQTYPIEPINKISLNNLDYSENLLERNILIYFEMIKYIFNKIIRYYKKFIGIILLCIIIIKLLKIII